MIGKKSRILPSIINDGINFYDDIIIIKRNETIKVFSSKCTHLGCKISNIESGKFVCKCHGSKFNEDGKVIEGPARKDLVELKINFDKSKQQLVVYE